MLLKFISKLKLIAVLFFPSMIIWEIFSLNCKAYIFLSYAFAEWYLFVMKTLVILYSLQKYLLLMTLSFRSSPFLSPCLWRQNFEILKDVTGESLHHMFHSFFPLALSPIFFLPRSILCSPGPSHAGIQAVALGPCFRPQPPPPSSQQRSLNSATVA